MELELLVLISFQILATSFFAKFEVGTPAWRKALKWFMLVGITIALHHFVGHYALIFPLFMAVLGTAVHFYICKKNGFDPINATPRKKYYEFRGWKWEE